MKTILVILFLGLPLIVFYQVDTKLSFDNETKAIQLTLENKYNAPILLNPKSDDESEKGTDVYKRQTWTSSTCIYRKATGKQL